jgi:hypothetical protein
MRAGAVAVALALLASTDTGACFRLRALYLQCTTRAGCNATEIEKAQRECPAIDDRLRGWEEPRPDDPDVP